MTPKVAVSGSCPSALSLSFPKVCREPAGIAGERGVDAQGAGHRSAQRKSALTLAEICEDGSLGLSMRPDCGEEIDRNYN